jgi:predicted permease
MPLLIKHAWRALRGRPLLSVVIAFTFSLGIGANTATYSYANALLFAPLPFPEPDRLVRIETLRGGTPGRLSLLELRDINNLSETLHGASFRLSQYTANSGGAPAVYTAAMSTYNIFEVLGVRPALGTTWPASDDGTRQFKVVLSHDFWQSRLAGRRDVIGQRVRLDSYDYEILGVMPRGFDFPVAQDVWRRPPASDFESRGIREAAVVARLKHGVSIAHAQRDLDRLATAFAASYPGTNRGVTYRVTPLRDYWLGSSAGTVVLLLGAVGLLLLLACANVSSLLTARAWEREGEWAMRAALGADRFHLLRASLAEVALLGAIGAAIGIAVAFALLPVIDRLLPIARPEWMSVAISAPVLVGSVVLGLVAATLAGLAPALRLTHADVATLIKRDSRSVGNSPSARLLVSAQVALAFVLLSVTLAFSLSVARLSARDAGFARDHLLTFQIDPPWTKYDRLANTTPFYDRLLREIGDLPGVRAVAANDLLPLASPVTDIAVERNIPIVEGHTAQQAERTPFVVLQLVNPGYHEAMGIAINAGRGLRFDDDSASPPVAVVSQSLAGALWPGENAIGKRLKPGALGGNYNPAAGLIPNSDPWFEVVGIVRDVKRARLDEAASYDLYLSHRQRFAPETFIAVRAAGDRAALLRAIETVLHRIDPDMATYDVSSMDQRIDATLWRERLATTLFRGFGLVATLLALVGIYGLMAQLVARQRRVIGVRMALGASPARVGADLLRDVARVLGLGLIAGGAILAATAPLGAWLAPALDWGSALVPSATALLLTLAGAIAGLVPAWRAARTDPVTAIRAG